MQREMRNLDPTLPLYSVKTLKEHMKIPLFPAKMAAGALGSFGVLALVLAAVGIYGVMSYVVAGRTREIGLRMALGAQTGNVRRLILRQGMTLAMIGSVIGLGIAFRCDAIPQERALRRRRDGSHDVCRRDVAARRGGSARVLDPRSARQPRRSDGGAARGVTTTRKKSVVIPRLAQSAEDLSSARECETTRQDELRRLRDAICDCEVPRRLRGSG